MKIVITGGNSFIGKALAKKAADRGNQVILVVRSRTQIEELPNISYVFADMEEYKKLGNMIGACDCMVNLSWNGTRGVARMDRGRQQANCQYTLAGIRSMLDVGCMRVVTAGSQAEYGPHEGIITEDTMCTPNTEYGIAKLELYEQVKSLCRKYKAAYIEPRFFSLYGPGDYNGTMVMSVLAAMLKNEPCKLSLGTQMWDFLYISDAVEGIWRLCSRSCENGVYNFGSGDVRMLKSYVLEMAEITQTHSELIFGAIPYPPTGMVSIWPDISRMKNRLDWTPQISFEMGIHKILEGMTKEA